MILLLLLSIPSIASAAIMGTRRRRTMEWIHASATVVALIVGASIGTRIWAGEPVVSWSLLRADALSAFMIGIVTFVGAVLVFYAASMEVGEIGLSWTMLISIAARLNPNIVKLAFIFILIGYGTKAGLAPMHTWLPDAHSEAPAPISALMSGVLLNVGIYALMRFKAVTDIAAGSTFSSTWLMRFGLLSLGLASAFLISQRNYKRMLAYSSVEHTRIVALGLGFGRYLGR